MSHHVRPLDVEVAQQARAIGGLLLGGDRSLVERATSAAIASSAVSDEPIAVSQRRVSDQRAERVGDERAMNKHDGIAAARDLVLQFEPVYVGPLHSFASASKI